MVKKDEVLNMKILVIGYGSMGRRRIRLVSQMVPECSFICVDTNPSRLNQIKEDGHIAFDRLDDAIAMHPEIAFVCTSPGHHAEIILQLISSHIHVFTELNLVSDYYDDIINKSKSENVKVFMSNTMLYDKQIRAIENVVAKQPQKLTYIYHVGQYLPDWHPWESYKDFFIGQKKTNGCREILAIQLPWIIRTFGLSKSTHVIKRKNTALEIDFDDTYIISIEHENGITGVFVCDVLARNAVNYLEVMGEGVHIRWDGTPESLQSFNTSEGKMERLQSYNEIEHIDGYAEIINEDQYKDEIKAFLDWVYDDKKPVYSFEDDKYILQLIDMIEGV